MFNNVYYKNTVIQFINLIAIVMPIIMILQDYELSKQYPLYLYSRIFTILFSVFNFLYVFINKKHYALNEIGIYCVLLFYAYSGMYYNTSYFLAFSQIIIGCAFFFSLQEKIYYSISIFSLILMIIIIYFGHNTYGMNQTLLFKFKNDFIIGLLVIYSLTFFGYKKITMVRFQKDLMSQKFLEIGKQTATVIHDLKGAVSAPTVYIDAIIDEINNPCMNKDELLKMATELKGDISHLRQLVLAMNQLSKVDNEITQIDIWQVCDDAKNLILKNHKINIKMFGEKYYICNEYVLRNAIFNMIRNSIENFEDKKVYNPTIMIKIEGKKLMYSDNGGGFSDNAIKSLKQNMSFTSKKNGSGMGLFVMRDNIESIGGEVLFSNNMQGVLITINMRKIHEKS